MTRPTIVFLVLLRLAIGWHFLFEGVEKYRADAWSSEGYLREASGPLGPTFHHLAGDVLGERLTPRPLPPGEEPGKANLKEYMPPRLDREWNTWFERFVNHYELDAEQRKAAEVKFEEHQKLLVNGLLTSKKSIEKPSPYGAPVKLEKSVAEWVADYGKYQQEAWDVETKTLPATHDEYEKKQVNDRIRSLKGDANRIRAALKRDVDQQTKDMQEAVRSVLTEEQWEKSNLSDSLQSALFQRDLLGWTDFLVPLGLVIVGSCLILGLLTRTSCVVGAVLLLSFYLAMPPWPGTPENLRTEGHYLIINKNIVEMLALLTLATLPTGRWAGLDRLLSHLGKRGAKPAPAKPQAAGQK